MVAAVQELLAAGWEALRQGDAATAHRVFNEALDQGAGADLDTAAATEGFARAAYMDLDFATAVDRWERAYALYRGGGDQTGAVRIARTLGYVFGAIVGDGAVMRGWIRRAQTLLGDANDSPERGWVALNMGMFEAERALKEQHYAVALEVARTTGDTDLELVTLAYLGASLVYGDRVDDGMALLDEALAAVAGYEADDYQILEEIFCQLFSACEHAHDVPRADQWIRVAETIAQRRKLPSVSAFCRTHYGGLLTVAGRWAEADVALNDAVHLWRLGQNSLQRGALVRLAGLRVCQGRYEEAEQLLDGMHTDAEAAAPLAAIYLARGDTALAADVIERVLAVTDPVSAGAAPLWLLQVDIAIADGDVGRARIAADRLAEIARLHGAPHLLGAAAFARGRVCVITGSGDARASLLEAIAVFSTAKLPLELARAHLELATAVVNEAPDVARVEADTALRAFSELAATRYADSAAALLRTLGSPTGARPRTPGELTKREQEVLELLGHGLSNPEISDRLYISRKTVEHHVARILAKLGLRSRAGAAAYATRTTSDGK